MAMGQKNKNIAINAICEGKAFRASTMKGFPVSDSKALLIGQLPTEYAAQYQENEVDYAVYSFHTPIAWRTTDGQWTVPDEKYSLTSTNHQNIVRQALKYL
jgi:hypothetical protein